MRAPGRSGEHLSCQARVARHDGRVTSQRSTPVGAAAPSTTDHTAEAGTLGELGEDRILELVFPRLPREGSGVVIGPGDDTALIADSGPVLATTDAMVRGTDWLDEWSSATDVGAKLVIQNLADLAAMGGVGTGVLVTLVAPSDLTLQWCLDFADGVAQACRGAGVPVIGGDLSSSHGETMVSLTALGRLDGHRAVTRSGATPGDVVAVSGPLGRSAAGWALLRDAGRHPEAVSRVEPGWTAAQRALVAYHRQPEVDLTQGPIAAAAGATALIDVSDGLLRDAGRIARASGVEIDLHAPALEAMIERLAAAVSQEAATDAVMAGGEEHVLLGCFPPGAVPSGWHTIGAVSDAPTSQASAERLTRVLLDGDPIQGDRGWDHFDGR